ncbi:MAG: hypothetical protein A2Y62_10035 [Candidatus Fischerbacteria bacterium RBG_13_37_8]|uniref:MobA-like NTP transferase domain-containing protein n=1 Tax=Candidatus Fischerbacteria bacterium RBG_13_37_8 TaxID=1817863 RepID=A0A1F5V5Y2_9BACT|nr:MAG: hypothetical protein A2Y62_10035 [Candidatus Fischerbacteria bacterium RBG_13_37_8]
MKTTIEAIILAAGRGERMGKGVLKALLPLGESTFIEEILGNLMQAEVTRIHIIAAEEGMKLLAPVSQKFNAELILNTEIEKGTLFSLWLGLQHLSEHSEGCISWPVDMPLVTLYTVKEILHSALLTTKSIIVPVYHRKRGHPVIFKGAIIPELLKAPLDKGARWVLHSFPEQVEEVPVNDEGILKNINTPEEYELLNK